MSILIVLTGLFVGRLLNIWLDRQFDNEPANLLNFLCPSCKEPLPFYGKIPLLGYGLLKGKCIRCRIPLSVRHPAMELAATVVLYFFYRKHGLSLEFFAATLLALLLILASLTDFVSGAIPPILTVVGLSAGIVLAFFRKPFFFWQNAFYGLLFGGALFVVAFFIQKLLKKEIVGFGDIGLLCVIGVFWGLRAAVFSLVAGSLFGALFGLGLIFAKGKDTNDAIPFSPFLSLGALFFMVIGDRFVYLFLRFIGA